MSSLFRGLTPVICLFAVFPAFSAALPTTPGDRDFQRDRQEQLLREQQKRLDELQQLPGKAAPEKPAEGQADTRCFRIRNIVLEGAEHLAASSRERLLAPYRDQCLGVGQLNELLKRITDDYLGRGFVTTRAYLPQQDLSSGTLKIIVVEGRLEGFDDSAVASPREQAMTFPGQTGDVLNLRELEQMVDQLNRLPSRQAQLELVPGQQVGGSRVQLKGERSKAWRVSAYRDNSGDRSSGEQQAGLGFDWDSPLGLADQLSLRTGADVVSDHWKHSDNQSLFYSLPYGWWTFSYGYNQSYYRTRNQDSGFAFKLDGDSESHQLRAERVIQRDDVSKTALNAGLAHVRSRNYIDDELIGVSSSRISESQFGFNHGRRIGNAFVNLDAGWQRGIGGFGAQGEHDPQPGEPHSRYDKYTLTLSYLQPFQLWGENFSFDALATGQKSEDVLYSPQRISLGGLNSVRGFKDQSLSGDSGYYWRNQLRWRRPVTWVALQPWLQEYGVGYGYDFGAIEHDRYNPEVHGRMSGHALEFNARGQHLAATLSFARSLERPNAIERREHPVYFRVDLFF
ncbi:ShlB/FhaC/HecB family hemolysin secretion/activation protein [Pseudomonas panipatensis]|uniref:Hemolysin activation/secretion protein n=1 Tax=Pseudomonas panipatensis TaxID=428992 RepID=A0A1G8LP87_9PSED|nr:ShlB/FhaC/HecB family hemolysin secretion/activation protein [Pseudomonas panipatensis]SDI57529.1 hemolysin activation/secretion protein [Pseudomonas panipatensis]SMP46481.1 hemolysin activation/secretion protein [Pseudomonas panipatensis]